jgi:CheY-like chemotaxis protein
MNGRSSRPIVLVVDDNVLNLELLKAFVGVLGCEVLPMRDGADVTEAVKSCRPAVVLMDIRMPGISGIDAARKLKENADTRDVPVYAFTAVDPKKMADNGDMSLFAGILRKPPTVESLKKILEAVGAIPAQNSSIA